MDRSVVLVIVLVAVFGWSMLAGGLRRSPITAPVVFVALGMLLALAAADIEAEFSHELKVLAELTLVMVLFSDAARVRFREIRHDLGLISRLLGIGLPLSIVAGTLLALVMFPQVGPWAALLIGAALAPTDAALGLSVITDPAVPARIRRVISVESGLNDGIATPVVLVAIAGVAAADAAVHIGVLAALVELAIGVAIGVVVGAAAGVAIRVAHRRGFLAPAMARPAVLAEALLAYVGALAAHGNGFIAAFIAGMVFAWATGPEGRPDADHGVGFVEEIAAFVSMIVWLAFGVALLTVLRQGISWAVVGYAVLSLTVVRMVPVALALVGSRVDRRTVMFIGWFGPRGLASVIFALLALETLGQNSAGAVAVIGLTVLLSVVAHGVTAGPLAGRYGTWSRGRTAPILEG